jgi:hypothetical protein
MSKKMSLSQAVEFIIAIEKRFEQDKEIISGAKATVNSFLVTISSEYAIDAKDFQQITELIDSIDEIINSQRELKETMPAVLDRIKDHLIYLKSDAGIIFYTDTVTNTKWEFRLENETVVYNSKSL